MTPPPPPRGFWRPAGRLGGRKWGALCSWLVGFFCLLGEIASVAGIAYTVATLISEYILLGTGGEGEACHLVVVDWW